MDAPASAQSPPHVNLVVRNVYTPSQSLSLSVALQTLVGELKRRLSVEFPSSPAVSAQKLIFGGKICGDDELLEQILAQVQKDVDNDEPVVLHLLVSSSGLRKSAEPKAPEPQRPEPEAAEAQDSPRPSSNAAIEPPSFNDQSMPAATVSQQPQFMFGQPPAMTQQQQHLYRQSMLMQQQAMVMQQIQYLQFLLMQQRQQATPSSVPEASSRTRSSRRMAIFTA
ncbi:hypothetical protein P3T76_001753 [Phytophthora citrophthora]|uniref:Ubiquitin-like domain-containing protein n=1 Tax=Phytophthora citrophthora TaxID=4793 RepID=A0AAD9GX79_9STRA|nr:hypothetical protein P3T76_001753 [Phytophthora citrophthora]